jgi:VWFA-related protein
MQSPSGQAGRPQFRAGVELVQIDVSVLDRERRPVTGLTASDFTLLEDGVLKPIRAFTAVRIPARAEPPERRAGAITVHPDVATNRAGNEDGRLVVILMDRSIPTGQPTVAARQIATAAVESLGPNDLAALVSTSGGVPQNFTSDRARLIDAIDQRDWSTRPSPEQEAIPTLGKYDPLADGRCLCGLCVLDTVTRVAEALQHAPRRHRMLLFVGNSLIFQSGPRAPRQDPGCGGRLDDAQRRMTDALTHSHVTVHSFDPGGLAGVGANTRAGAPGGKPGDSRSRRWDQLRTDITDLLTEQGSLHVLPDLTGGRTILNTNGPAQLVPDVFAESAAYYVLAFEPGTPGRDGDLRIDVRVARPGVTVHTQRHYLGPARARPAASGASAPSPLDAALHGLLPNAARPLTLAVAAFAGAFNSDAPRHTVIVNVDVRGFAEPGETSIPLEFAVGAMDPTGRQMALARQSATISFAPATPNGPPETNIQTQLELRPGDYELRVAVRDPARDVVASVFAPVVVPRFDEATLTLSDVIVQTAGHGGAAQAIPQPTTRRLFERGEQVRGLIQIYQGTGRTHPLRPVSVRTRILDDAGRPVRDQLMRVGENDFSSRTAGVAVDMSDLPAGAYVLIVEAALEDQRAGRSIPFAVRRTSPD